MVLKRNEVVVIYWQSVTINKVYVKLAVQSHEWLVEEFRHLFEWL